MNPVSPWIAASAEQCLASYLGQSDEDEILVDDAEGCLTFSGRSLKLKTAIVVSWKQADNGYRATLTDSKNQIDAIMSAESTDMQEETSRCPPTTKGGPRHLVELADIKLVLSYSEPVPELYLHVNRFKFHHNAIRKGDVPKPKLRKAPGLNALITMAYEKGQKDSMHAGSGGQTFGPLVNSFASEHDTSMVRAQVEDDPGSQLLLSQFPPNIHHGQVKESSSFNRVPFSGPSELLGLLAASRPSLQVTNGERPVSYKLSQDESKCRHALPQDNKSSESPRQTYGVSTLSRPSSRGTVNTDADGTHVSTSAIESLHSKASRDVDELILEVAGQTAQPFNQPNDFGPFEETELGPNHQPSKKRRRDSTDAPSENARDDELNLQDARRPISTSPSKKRQRTDAGTAFATDASGTERKHSDHGSAFVEIHTSVSEVDPVYATAPDPWEGLTHIPLREIDIPKDQADLLEERQWIPQDSGLSGPLCHVPPFLLMEWNNIARRRKRMNEEEERLSEHPPTPTPQETQDTQSDAESGRLPWSPSPARDALPRDTVTPPRQQRAIHSTPTPSGIQHRIGQTPQSSQNTSSSLSDGNNGSRDSPVPTRSQSPRPPWGPESLESQHLDFKAKTQNQTSAQSDRGQPPIPIQKRSEDPFPAEPLTMHELDDESSDAESDDAEMETTVPLALGGSVPLSSQPEPDRAGSDQYLSRLAGGMVQVAETPVVYTKSSNRSEVLETHIIRTKEMSPEGGSEAQDSKGTDLSIERQTRQVSGPRPPSSQHQQVSSQAFTTSSASWVPNTYHSEDNHAQNHTSREALNSSLPTLGDDSLGLNGDGTQTQSSSAHVSSQMPTHPSLHSERDSSRPVRRDRGSSIFHLETSDNFLSSLHASSDSIPLSHINTQSQESSKGLSSREGGSQLPEATERDSTACLSAHAETPSKGLSTVRRKHTEPVQEPPHNSDVGLVARRQGFLGKRDKSAEAQTVYEKFCNAYALYTGNFTHFTLMCWKLQTMRQRGLLERSFLWDDFVIQHQEAYLHHLAERHSQDSKTTSYEEFFCANFSRPQHKRRSLTARGIEVVASQFVYPNSARPESPILRKPEAAQVESVQHTTPQCEGANVFFPASFVEKFSNLHAQSFTNVPIPDAHSPTQLPSSTRSSSASVRVKQEEKDILQSVMKTCPSASIFYQAPPPLKSDEDMVNATQPDIHDIDMEEIDETQEGEDTQGADHTHHETASIELGDDTDRRRVSPSPDRDTGPVSPTAPAATSRMESESEPEPPIQRNNWFRSLANMFPTGPVWSDDPNTPFKRWARHDQNLLVEINRRGGTKVQIDEKGVICRPTYHPRD